MPLKVDMYDANTRRWIKSYPSITEASLDTGISVSSISKNLRGDLRAVGNRKYYFRSNNIEYKPKYKSDMHNYKGKPVKLYKIGEGYIATFGSSKEAAEKLGFNKVMISQNLNGKIELIKKRYYFKFVERW